MSTSTESSVIARKLENYYNHDNSIEGVQAKKKILLKKKKKKKKVSQTKKLVRDLLSVMLMSLAVKLTKLTLFVTRLIKKIEYPQP